MAMQAQSGRGRTWYTKVYRYRVPLAEVFLKSKCNSHFLIFSTALDTCT